MVDTLFNEQRMLPSPIYFLARSNGSVSRERALSGSYSETLLLSRFTNQALFVVLEDKYPPFCVTAGRLRL